jgi:hypothetical protein
MNSHRVWAIGYSREVTSLSHGLRKSPTPMLATWGSVARVVTNSMPWPIHSCEVEWSCATAADETTCLFRSRPHCANAGGKPPKPKANLDRFLRILAIRQILLL